jgi:hypothetical protein
LLLVLESCCLVRPIAKGLIRGVAATAKRHGGPAAEAVRLSFHVDEFDFPFDAQRAVIADGDFCWWHLRSKLPDWAPRRGRGLRRKAEPANFF